tara:strand:+ start:180 stop:416 length:237 start_codon:yes stop_codon:yes gene_type:complete
MSKLFTFSILALSLCFFSCKKCKTCTTSVTQTVLGIEQTSSSSDEYCGKDYENAPAETDVTNNVPGINQRVVISCKES